MKDFSKYLAIPFKSRGRDFAGCDCWGLCRLFLKNEMGIEADSFSEYGVENYRFVKEFVESEKQNWSLIQCGMRIADCGIKDLNSELRTPYSELPQVGDIVELKSGRQWHIGIVAADGYILHIEEGNFAKLVSMKNPVIKNRIHQFWRHRSR